MNYNDKRNELVGRAVEAVNALYVTVRAAHSLACESDELLADALLERIRETVELQNRLDRLHRVLCRQTDGLADKAAELTNGGRAGINKTVEELARSAARGAADRAKAEHFEENGGR